MLTSEEFIDFNGEFTNKVLGNKLEAFFRPLMIGKKIVSKGEADVGYYFKVKMRLENGDEYETKYHWSELTGIIKFMEESKGGPSSLDEYFHLFLENREIKDIYFRFGRNFELYLVCKMENSEGIVNIPLGIELSKKTFSGWLKKIFTEEEKENFMIMHSVCYHIVQCRDGESITAEKRIEIYENILVALNIEGGYHLSDFYKLDKMYKVYKTERIECSDLYADIERIIYE